MQVWGCMGASGVGTLKIVTGRLNAAGYVRLIGHTLVEDGRKLCGTDFVFQQEGAPAIQLRVLCPGLNEWVLQLVHGHLKVLTSTQLSTSGR